MPYGLTVQDNRLAVADTANARLIALDTESLAMGHAVTRLPDLVGARYGNNRVLGWEAAP